MNLGVDGKRALILGGNKGLGRGVAAHLAAEGAIVGLVGRDEEALQATLTDILVASPASFGIRADLDDPADVSLMLARIDREWGGVDILLLNGGGPPPYGAYDTDAARWHRQFDAIFMTGLRITAHVLPGMRARRWGRLLVVSSTSVREPIKGLTASNALRAAVAGWAKSLAGEVAADGVTVNLLLAGRLDTDRTRVLDRLDAEARGVSAETIAAESQAEVPIGRYGTPDEFGAVAAFLASDLASYVTGSAIPIDGGLARAIL
ncbi:SDR family oxidoreductase [Labrys sp. LIt4]|uniref:SDR family oxidoreductase n=1 Tax=Labrys sp. LIt4 TaxID=2821355 RepID=UPI001AE0199A|nr:SDR family oxidoreductase [Labrys sp. LIt4]MBP0578233.1 SDR family oxidoreductase [Labrys sp. LIt4]